MNEDEIEEDVISFLKAVDWSKMKITELPPSQPDFKFEYCLESKTEENTQFRKILPIID